MQLSNLNREDFLRSNLKLLYFILRLRENKGKGGLVTVLLGDFWRNKLLKWNGGLLDFIWSVSWSAGRMFERLILEKEACLLNHASTLIPPPRRWAPREASGGRWRAPAAAAPRVEALERERGRRQRSDCQVIANLKENKKKIELSCDKLDEKNERKLSCYKLEDGK